MKSVIKCGFKFIGLVLVVVFHTGPLGKFNICYGIDPMTDFNNLIHSCKFHSEGLSLTQDDERTYWGKIIELESVDRTRKKIEVEGAIMLGTGLEPCSIGRFRMIEMEEEIDYDEDESDEDEGYILMSTDDLDESSKRFDSLFDDDDFGAGKTFDFPSGSFE